MHSLTSRHVASKEDQDHITKITDYWRRAKKCKKKKTSKIMPPIYRPSNTHVDALQFA